MLEDIVQCVRYYTPVVRAAQHRVRLTAACDTVREDGACMVMEK
jgi:hypothetical protein